MTESWQSKFKESSPTPCRWEELKEGVEHYLNAPTNNPIIGEV